MTSTGVTTERPLRLRFMIESWAGDGLVRPEVAAQALTPGLEGANPLVQPTTRLRRLEGLGYVGAAPVAAAGLLLVDSHVGTGYVLLLGLLIAIASPRAVRLGPVRIAGNASHQPLPRHRARPANPVRGRGPKAYDVVPNGRFGTCRPAPTLESTTSR